MIRSLIFTIIVFGLVCTLSSCDNFTKINGYVLDPAINEAVAEAHIYVETKSGLFKTSTKKIDDLGTQVDTISVSERKEYIKNHGNKDGWMLLNLDGKILNGQDRMIRHFPLKTDLYGSFEILLHSDNYTLFIEKEGYETLAIERKDIGRYQTLSLYTFKLKKKSGA